MIRRLPQTLAWLAVVCILGVPHTASGLTTTRFPGEESYPDMGGAGEVVSADFDGDDWPDLAATQSGGVSIWLNDRTGRFRLHERIELGAAGIGAADLDGDDVADLALTIPAGPLTRGRVAVLMGLDDGRFGPPSFHDADFLPNQIQILDVDGNGQLDLAVVNSEMVSIYLGRGDGTFGPRLDSGLVWHEAPTPRFMNLADVDRDNKIDAVVTEEGPHGIQILRGRGDGTFWLPTGIDVDWVGFPITTRDLDGDGAVDVIATQGEYDTRQVVLWNDGFGTFAARETLQTVFEPSFGYPTSSLVIDSPLEAEPSVALAGNNYSGDAWIAMLRCTGDRRFEAGPIHLIPTTPELYWPLDAPVRLLDAIDLDRDGFQDFVMDRGGGADRLERTMNVLRHSSGAHYRSFAAFETKGWWDLHALRTAPSGRTVLVRPTTAGLERIELGPDLVPGEPVIFAPPSKPRVADLNGDGFDDLVHQRGDAIEVELATIDGQFVSVATWSPYRFLDLGDFDKRHGLDLALIDSAARVWLARNDGRGHFEPLTETSVVLEYFRSTGAGDVMGDDADELIVIVHPSWGLSSLLVFSLEATSPVPLFVRKFEDFHTPIEVEVADLDGDGRRDVVVHSSGFSGGVGSIHIFRNVADGVLEAQPLLVARGENGADLYVADMDLDHRPDLVVRGYMEATWFGIAQILFNDGGMNFSTEIHGFAGQPSGMVIADFDGDQRPDIAAQTVYRHVSFLQLRFNATQDVATPALVSFAGSEIQPDGVRLRWLLSEASHDVRVQRCTDASWQDLGTPVDPGTGLVEYVDRTVSPGMRYAYRLRLGDGMGATYSDVVEVEIPGIALAIRRISPNPASEEATVRLAVPTTAPVHLELFDVSGRRAHEQVVVITAPGEISARVAAPRRLHPGVYLLRVRQEHRTATTRLAIVR